MIGWHRLASSWRRCCSFARSDLLPAGLTGPGIRRPAWRGARARVHLILAALVAGEFLRRIRMPRLTGYLLFGLLSVRIWAT